MSSAASTQQLPADEVNLRPTIKDLLKSLSDVSGLKYFQKLSSELCNRMGMDIAFVGQLVEKGTKMRTLGMMWDGNIAEPITYGLSGTPFQKTFDRDYCMHREGVQKKYPKDHMLIDENIEGYIGYPLRDENNKPIGAIVALSRKPITVNDNIMEITKVAAARARAELLHHITQERLKETLSEALLLNYSKSMFMANISHELRNPLSAMIGYASLIRDRQVDSQNVHEYANEICLAGEELLALISDILSLSTLEISGESVERTEFDLTETARTGRRLLQEQAAAKNLALLPILRAEPLYVLGDSKHTKKALLNLITNAVKFTSLGEIEITVDTNDEGEAVMAVRDTGIGMTKEQIENASQGLGSFEHAYNMHQDGRGLGLPLTHLLIERQGGRIEIESRKGTESGTTICVIFGKQNVTGAKGDFI